MVSHTSTLQTSATFSSAENSVSHEPFSDPATVFVDKVLSANPLPLKASVCVDNPGQVSTEPQDSSSTRKYSVWDSSPLQAQKSSTSPAVQLQDASPQPVQENAAALVSSTLSSSAKVWIPTSSTKVKNLDLLYPVGKNSDGVEYELSDEAFMALEFGEKSSCEFELPVPAKPDLDKVSKLFDNKVALPNGSTFVDKILPPSAHIVQEDEVFSAAYFIDLHKKVRLSGTYNFAGAQVELAHSRINVDLFRQKLEDYDDKVVCQFLQYGFPLGLAQEVYLEPCLKNHQSAYLYFSYIDKFLHKEVTKFGVVGPLPQPPFNPTMLSPMMTSTKNPDSRRPVFDASWGDWSLNENTPAKSYMGGTYEFKFPTVLDLADLIIKEGRGCLLWKRDLSRWFLQLPVDPADYDKLGFLWRGMFWWFVSYVWGTRHAGYNGQRVATAILFIFVRLGIIPNNPSPYNAIVYMDDFAGCEMGFRATEAFDALGQLLQELGVQESVDKASKPSTKMKFLGVEFDTISMCMRIDEKKLQEITMLSKSWARKTVATKQELQSVLGKLMWVSKVVRHSRCFVARIIGILKGLRTQKQKVTLSSDVKKDFLWWSHFLPVFNGVELLVPATVFCSVIGDATLRGGGCWNEKEMEYFSRLFPAHLMDHAIPIHIKEFLVTIVAVKLWGHLWEGKRVAFYCDNEAVVKTMIYQKPRDSELQRCLREMLFLVCKFRFQPVFLRISTEDNDIADFISRVHDREAISAKFVDRGLPNMNHVYVPDERFDFVADW